MGRYSACLLVAVLAAVQPARASGDDLDKLPGVTTIFYDISGSNPQQLRRAMTAAHIVDPADGRPVDAYSTWYIRWHWNDGADGRCDLSTVQVHFSGTVKLPRLVGSVPRPLAARWRAYMAALRRHEAGHLDFAHAHVPAVLAAVRSAGRCEDANAAGERATAEINRHDRVYDAETDHGRTQGAVFP